MEEKLKTICNICLKNFEHLGSHIAKAHNMTAKEYKEKYGLPHNFSLISDAVREKKRLRFEEEREKYLKNLSRSKKYQFKKGDSRHKKGLYFSDYEKKNLIKRIEKNIVKGICPFCKVEFNHLQSHLINKHNYLLIENTL